MSGSEPKQRLVAIDVGEVSIVDHPANEQPFVVTKAKQEAAAEVAKAVGVLLDPYTATYATMDAMRDCIYALADKLRDPSKLDDAKAEIERIKTMLDNATQFASMVTKAATDIATEVSKAKDGAADKAVPAFMIEAVTKAVEVLKSAMGVTADTIEVQTEKALETVLKAGKAQFSKERMTKLHEAFVHMASMYKDADAEGFQKAWDGMSPKDKEAAAKEAATKTDKAGEPSVGAAAPAWFDTAISALSKKIDDATAGVTEVSKRVETIEKTEAVSKALPATGNDGKPVVKAGSMWKGVV